MVTHMKTTVDIADHILEQAKGIALRESSTLRALVEEGLRTVVARHGRADRAFRLRDASVDGNGLSPEFELHGWAAIRGAAYEERGG